MQNISGNSKRVKLKEKLSARIISGEFVFGDKFLGLNQLCQEYDVSYVTANKAMKLLVKEGYIQAKNGVGYFVCYVQSGIIPPRKVVNFITGLGQKSPAWRIIMQGKELFESAGWYVKLLTISDGDLSSCISDINSPDAYSLLFFTKLNWENFAATFGHIAQRVVVLGHLSGNADITSIISDEYETVRRCIEYFRERKHFRTALVSVSPYKELDMLRIAAWRSLMLANAADSVGLDLNCFCFTQEQLSSESAIRKAYSEWIRKNKGKFDSVIDPFAPLLLKEACFENNLSVPGDISIIRIARSQSALPDGIPTLDNNLFKHFQFALDILEERFKTGKKSPGAWIFCPPGKIL